MNWPGTTIQRISLQTGVYDPRKHKENLFKYIDIASIDREAKTITQASELKGSEAPSRARKEVRVGDILVSTVRPNLNAVAIVPPELNGEIASTGFSVLRPNKELIDGRYLFYFVQTSRFIDTLISKVRGAHYPAVSDADIKEIKLPLPELDEQRRIVEILSQADTLRKQTNEADTKTAHIIPALYYQMFGDPVMNSMNWKLSSLSRLGAKVRYGLGQPPALLDGGLPMIRATNISRGIISETDMIFINHHALPKGREVFLEAEEVLVVRSGAYTGDVAQVTEEWAGSVAGYDLIVNPGEKMIGEFLEAYLLTSFIQDGYFSKHKSRAGQPHLNANQLLATPTPDIPKNLQEKFSLYVNTVREIRKCTIRRVPAINRLYEVLLSQAFSGKLTTNWRQAHMNELLQGMEHQAKMLS